MASAVACRKRSAAPFLDDVIPAPPHLSKRARFSPCPVVAAQPPHLASDPLEHQAARVASAAARSDGGGMEECAGILVEQMAAAADMADARARGTWILKLIEGAVAARAAAGPAAEAAALREENAAVKARADALEIDNGVLKRGVAAQQRKQEEMERDNGVLKRAVAVLHGRMEEAERAAEEMRKKVAELAAANYALAVQVRGNDSCRFQMFRGPDVF